MRTIACVVEGHSEVASLPLVLRKLNPYLIVPPPIRPGKSRFLNDELEFRRTLLLAKAKCGPGGAVLIFLDADDDCPAQKGPEILAKASTVIPGTDIACVLAEREYEAWFLAAFDSLRTHLGLSADIPKPGHPERIRNAKGHLRELLGRSYNTIVDQPALTARMDFDEARKHAASFDKLCRDIERLCPMEQAQ